MGLVLLTSSPAQQGPTGATGPAAPPGGGPSGPTASPGPETLSACRRAIISLWFRVPKSSIDRVLNAYAEWKARDTAVQDAGGYGVVPPAFNGIIPLLTFGEDTEHKNVGYKGVLSPEAGFSFHGHQWDVNACDWHYVGPNPIVPTLIQQAYDGKFDYRTSPSYIGVDCKPMFPVFEDTPGEPHPKLVFCIQTQNKAETSGGTNMLLNQAAIKNSDVDDWNIVTPVDMTRCHPDGHMVFYGPNNQWHYFWFEPISEAFTEITVEEKLLLNDEVFQTLPGPYSVAGSVGSSVPVIADRWHHVLLSFDLTDPCITKGNMDGYQSKAGTVTSAPQLWIAFDGQNLTKKRLSHFWPVTGKPNDFLSVNAKRIYDSNFAQSYSGLRTYVGDGTLHYQTVIGEKPAEFSYTFDPLRLLPMGLPSTSEYSSHIRHVEMAELQIFPGICIDTGIAAHREAFIKGGKPVPPDKKATAESPVSGSIEYLKREPEVLLHGTRKWQKGDNTGRGADFKPTGNIKKYTPDPSLGGDQGVPQ